MKVKLILSVMIILLFFTGCSNNFTNPTESSLSKLEHEFIVDGVLDKETVMSSYLQNEQETSRKMAEAYIYAIKNGQDLAHDEDAIEIFDLLFDRETLTVTDPYPADYMPDTYRCDIMGTGSNGDRKIPLFLVFQENEPSFFCPVIYYGKRSRQAVESYLTHLTDRDEDKLSQWLSIDGGKDYYMDEAKQLIEFYSQYDLSKTEIINFDYDYETDKIVYCIQDANMEQFKILMSYGDGFSMPDINSVLNKRGEAKSKSD